MKKRQFVKKVGGILLRLKEFVDYVAIVGFFYILLYQIEALRIFCRLICEYLIDWFLPVRLSDMKEIYLVGEKRFRVAIVLSIIAMFLSALVKTINEKKLKSKYGENRFEKSLFRYLNDITVPRCFLVTGQWGSGKSYEVKHFFDKYYNYTKTQVYRVSCFGLNSRRELIDEINSIIEQNDKSLQAQMIKVVQYIPVIGDALNKLFKKSYGCDSINKGSIFIFEDFERITSRSIINDYSGRLYEQSNSFHYGTVRHSQYKEFQEIKSEFESIDKAFARVEDFVNKNSLREDYDKYIAIVGFINELIEVYEMKVVVVCNSDILGERFIHDVLRSKLNCMEYKKVITSETKESIIENILESKIVDDKEKQACIKAYINQIKANIEDVELDVKFKDMRLFGGLLEAFIDTALLFDKDMLTEEFLSSLLNSIMIVHLGYYKNSSKKLDEYINGANIEFLNRIYGGPLNTTNLIRLPGGNEAIKWIDARVSGFWIYNLSVPEDMRDVCETWKKYRYAEFEQKIIKDPEILIQESDYNLLHVLFYQKVHDGDSAEWEYRAYIEKALFGYELEDIEVIDKILDDMYQIFNGRFFNDFQEAMFEILAKGKADGEIRGRTYIHDEYSKFLLKTNVP